MLRARAVAWVGCFAVAMVGAGVMSASAGALTPTDNDKEGVIWQGAIVNPTMVNAFSTLPVKYTAEARIKAAAGGLTSVTITNPASNADLGGSAIITGATLFGPDGGRSGSEHFLVDDSHPGPDSTVGPGCATRGFDSETMDCHFSAYAAVTASLGIAPGQSATITYYSEAGQRPDTFYDDYGPVLRSVYVNFDFGDLVSACRPSGYSDSASQATFGPSLAMAARKLKGTGYASDCVPPLRTRITTAHVNAHARTATFKQTAQHASGFFCQLYRGRRGHRLVFAHNCGATKVYANPLPAGHYIYYVWGLNNHGRSPMPGVKAFNLK